MRSAGARWAPGALLAIVLLATSSVAADLASPITFVRAGLPHDALFDIAFDQRTGLAVGNHGAVLETVDGGASWAAKPPLGTLALTAVALDGERTIIVGQQGAVYVSDADGTYARVETPTTERLLGVALSGDLAVAVGGFGTLLVSHDAGRTWDARFLDWSLFHDEGLEAHLYDVEITDDGAVYVCGEFELVLRSSDGGERWEALHQGEASLFALQLGDLGRGFAVGQEGTVLQTSDGGSTWTQIDIGTRANLLDVWQSPQDEVVVVGMRALARSSDAGASWRLLGGRTVERSWYQALASSVVVEPLADNGSIRKEKVYAVGQTGNIVTVDD